MLLILVCCTGQVVKNNTVNPFDHNEVVNDDVLHKSHLDGILYLVLVGVLLILSQVFLTLATYG